MPKILQESMGFRTDLYYERLWSTLEYDEQRMQDIARDAVIVASGEAQYKPIALRWNIPWYVVGLIHLMEAGHEDDPWERGIHNGMPWYEPNSYIRDLKAFGSWRESVDHAVGSRVADAARWEPWGVADVSRFLDQWNGCGKYQKHGVNSPYLYAASNHGVGSGKYKRTILLPDGRQEVLCCCTRAECGHRKLTNGMRIGFIYLRDCHQEQCGTITLLHYMLHSGLIQRLAR